MEDRDAACSIQAVSASGANEHLTFGHYEKAAAHFHRTLTEHLPLLLNVSRGCGEERGQRVYRSDRPDQINRGKLYGRTSPVS